MSTSTAPGSRCPCLGVLWHVAERQAAAGTKSGCTWDSETVLCAGSPWGRLWQRVSHPVTSTLGPQAQQGRTPQRQTLCLSPQRGGLCSPVLDTDYL